MIIVSFCAVLARGRRWLGYITIFLNEYVERVEEAPDRVHEEIGDVVYVQRSHVSNNPQRQKEIF